MEKRVKMHHKILLVDDDRTFLSFLEEYMMAEKFTVFSAASGAQGLKVAYREQPDLVILDVMMPGMDGWEVIRRLRELSDVPIILLTGKASEEDKLRGFRLGVDDYVVKPFSFAELAARIQAVLSRSRRPAPSRNILPMGEIRLDLDRRELRRGEQNIQLTPTEYRLLEVLARNPGKAVAESELIQAIWNTDQTGETAVIRRYIWLLRQKIEPDPSRPIHILTVRGYGYRLEG
jgi:DNA-binding response OmpR family regulator